jgi:hypothetical protein
VCLSTFTVMHVPNARSILTLESDVVWCVMNNGGFTLACLLMMQIEWSHPPACYSLLDSHPPQYFTISLVMPYYIA